MSWREEARPYPSPIFQTEPNLSPHMGQRHPCLSCPSLFESVPSLVATGELASTKPRHEMRTCRRLARTPLTPGRPRFRQRSIARLNRPILREAASGRLSRSAVCELTPAGTCAMAWCLTPDRQNWADRLSGPNRPREPGGRFANCRPEFDRGPPPDSGAAPPKSIRLLPCWFIMPFEDANLHPRPNA